MGRVGAIRHAPLEPERTSKEGNDDQSCRHPRPRMKKRPSVYAREQKEEEGCYVRLTGASIKGLNRLKTAYGMLKRQSVIEYLVEQGVKGLDEAECAAEIQSEQARLDRFNRAQVGDG